MSLSSTGKLSLIAILLSCATAFGSNRCPGNYVLVPALKDYTAHDFCIAKYEAKQAGPRAVSRAAGPPWVNVKREEARKACAANGPNYALITNAEWQSVARNIESVADNWSGKAVGQGALSNGYSNNRFHGGLAASPDDRDPCFGTGNKCSQTEWNRQRRTFTLTTGGIVWDLAGNVWEIMNDDIPDPKIPMDWSPFGADARFAAVNSERNRYLFGPSRSTYRWNQGMGVIGSVGTGPGVGRGSNFDDFLQSGIFAAAVGGDISESNDGTGFRCVFHPE